MPISTEDYVSISDHLGRYCWAVDEGEADEWASLWTEDGVFAGVMPEPVEGREGLRQIPLNAGGRDGPMRHMICNLTCEYQGGKDTVFARYYNLVSNWAEGAKLTTMALSRVVLVRNGDGWLIKRNDTTMLTG